MRITACSIVKNEEKNIVRSIESYRSAVDEIIIVDTGSTDRTVELCERLGAKVLHYKWDNDFASAKNLALEKATGDWIIFLDADEWFEPKLNSKKLVEAINTVHTNKDIDILKVKFFNIEETNGKIVSSTVIGRIFRNSADLRFEGAIHEEIRKGNKQLGIALLDELKIYHSGYSKDRVMNKCKRNLDLLNDCFKKGKIDHHTYFYLCRENFMMGNNEEAQKFCERFLAQDYIEEIIKGANVLTSIYEYNVKLKINLNKQFTIKDVKAAIELAMEKYPDIPMHYYLEGCYYKKLDSNKALHSYKEAIKRHKAYKLDYVNNFEANLFDAYFQIALIYDAKQDNEKAFKYILLALKEKPFDESAFKELITLVQKRSSSEILLILDKVYDMRDREQVDFITHQLMGTACKEVFVHFAKRYNQEFDGQDETTYLAMLLCNQVENMVNVATQAYLNGGREDDRYFIALGILYGRRQDLFDRVKFHLNPAYAMIVNRYINGQQMVDATENELRAWIHLYGHMSWLATEEELLAFEKVFVEFPIDIVKVIIEHALSTKNYSYILSTAERLREQVKDEAVKLQLDKAVAVGHFYTQEYETSLDELQKLLENPNVDLDVKLINCLQGMEDLQVSNRIKRRAKQLYDKYYSIYYQTIVNVGMLVCGKVDEIPRVYQEIDFVNLSVSEFNGLISNDQENMPTFALDALYGVMEVFVEQEKNDAAVDVLITLVKYEYNKDKMYFRLGQVLNKMGNIELATYCHEKVLKENTGFAKTIISDEKSKNREYIYRQTQVQNSTVCSICGEQGILDGVYNIISSDDFSEAYAPIKKWRYCKKCEHKFVENVPAYLDTQQASEKEVKLMMDEAVNKLADCDVYMDNIRKHKPIGKILDVGCRAGSLLMVAAQYGYTVKGLEMNDKLVNRIKEELELDIEVGELQHYHTKERYDVITFINQLENSIGPKEEIKKAYELLEQEGIVYIKTPNFESAYAKLKKDKCETYRTARICNYFSKASLEQLLVNTGFSVLEYRMIKGDIEIIAKK